MYIYIYIYILSIKYNNVRENKTTARAIGKLVCSTPSTFQ